MMLRSLTVAVAAALALSGCGADEPKVADPTSAAPTSSSTPSPTPTPTSTSSASPEPAPVSINFGAVGPVSAGMTVAEAERTGLIEREMRDCGDPEHPVLFLRWKGQYAEKLDVMLDRDRNAIAALGVGTPDLKTEAGVGVGSTYAELKATYGDRLGGPRPQAVDDGPRGVDVADGDGYIGFLLDAETEAAITDSTTVSFVEVSRGERPSLYRDGC